MGPPTRNPGVPANKPETHALTGPAATKADQHAVFGYLIGCI